MNSAKKTVKSLVKVSALALVASLSQNLYAASTITAPDDIVIVGINDQAIKSSLLKKSKEYKVNPGALSLSVRYQAYFEDNLNRHDIVKSDVLRLDVPQIQDNQRYVLKLINAPKDHDDAKKYAEQPMIALFDQNNQQVVQELKMSNQPRNSILGGLFSDSVDLTQAAPTNNSSVAIRQTAKTQSSTGAQPVNTQIAVKQASTQLANVKSVDQHMIQLWQNASKAERQKFMTWLAEQ